MANTCAAKLNLGPVQCSDLPQQYAWMLIVPSSFSITAANAVDPTFWQTQIEQLGASRVFKFPRFFDSKDQSEATIYQKTALGVKKIRDGRYEFVMSFAENMCIHRALSSHNGSGDRVILGDVEDKALLTKLAGGTYSGFLIDIFNNEKLKISDGSNATVSNVTLSLKNSKELDQRGYSFDFSFFDSLAALADVDLTVIGTSTTTTIKVTVIQTCDGTPISGLIAADFVVKNTTGTVIPVTGILETAPGAYTLTGTAFIVGGTVDIKPAATLTINGYESTGPKIV